MTFTQPWRSAFAVWTVMAQAQTEFALRAMGMTAPRTGRRRARPCPAPPSPVAAPVALRRRRPWSRRRPSAGPRRRRPPWPRSCRCDWSTEASDPAIAAATARRRCRAPSRRPRPSRRRGAVEVPRRVLPSPRRRKIWCRPRSRPLVAAEEGRERTAAGTTCCRETLPAPSRAPYDDGRPARRKAKRDFLRSRPRQFRRGSIRPGARRAPGHYAGRARCGEPA